MALALSFNDAQAQETQDALYIYRNDGQFNAFFFDDIDRFEYSHIDTLGIEHSDYVVQEVYALDSIWRIPLSAIDSVSFVTPTTIYQKGVVIADKRLVDYITGSDSIYWIQLAKNTPIDIIPKVGDKLIIEEECRYLPYGFGGLVTQVESVPNGYKVTTKAMDISDVYERVVIKAGTNPPPDPSDSRRKIFFDGDQFGSAKTFDLGTIKEKYIAQGSQNIIELFDGNLTAGMTGKGELDLELTPKLTSRCFLLVNLPSGLQYKIEEFLKFDVKVAADLTLNGGVNGHIDIPFKLKDPFINLGKVKIGVGLGYFLDGTGETYFKANYKGRFEAGNFTYRKKMLFHEEESNAKESMKYTPELWSTEGGCGDVTFKCGFYAKAELALPFMKDTIATVGLRAEGALQVTTEAPVLFTSVSDDLKQTYYDGLYKALNKDDNFRTNFYVGLQGYLKKNWTQWTLVDKSLPFMEMSIGVVPNIDDVYLFSDDSADGSLLGITAPIWRACINTPVGFAIFDRQENKLLHTWWYPQEYGPMVNWSNYYYEYTMDPDRKRTIILDVYPMIRYFGRSILTDQHQEHEVDPAWVYVDKEVTFSSDIQSKELKVTFNIPDLTFTSDANWLTAFFLRDDNSLTLTTDVMPDGMTKRECKVHIVGKTTKGEVVYEDDIKVTQTAPAITLNTSVLRFTAEGGTATASIVSTTLTGLSLRVSQNDDFVQARLDGNTITVTVTKNTFESERVAIVYISGKTPEGDTGEGELLITQEAASGSGTEPVVGETLHVKDFYIWPGVGEVTSFTDFKWDTDTYYLSDYYAPDGFNGIDANEDDIANGLFAVSATIVNDSTIHVVCSGGKQYDYEEEWDWTVPTWKCTRQNASFDIVKITIDEWNYFKITNVHYDEKAEWYNNSEKRGKNKSGYVDFKTSGDYLAAGIYNEYYDSNYYESTTLNGLMGRKGKVVKDDISNFELKWELYEYNSTHEAYDYMRAEYSKSDGYVNVGIRFIDDEKFNEWARKLLNTSN